MSIVPEITLAINKDEIQGARSSACCDYVTGKVTKLQADSVDLAGSGWTSVGVCFYLASAATGKKRTVACRDDACQGKPTSAG